MVGPSVSRRAVLAAALLLPVIAACSGGTTPDPSPTGEDPDLALRARIADQESELISSYEAAVRRFPELAKDLNPILEQHRAHRTALGAASASASPSATATADSAAETLALLAAAESAAADDCTTACVKSTGEETARLLALISASEQSHVPYLDGIVL